MFAETFVIECRLCQRGWEVAEKVENVPRRSWIRLPSHEPIDDHGEARRGRICPGGTRANIAGLPGGTRQHWEKEWRLRAGGALPPALLDGADVRVISLGR